MKLIPPVIDENGDIQLHGRQGAVIPVNFVDSAGAPRNMVGQNVTFECGVGVDKTLTAGATNDQMLITLDNADVKAIYAQDFKDFVVLDHSGAEPTPVWAGTVYIYGWVE